MAGADSDARDASVPGPEEPASGLLRAVVLDGAGGVRPVAWEEAARWSPEGGVLWVHLDLGGSEAERWLESESGLDEIVVEALVVDETHPRATRVGDGVILVLRGVNLNPGADPEDMVAVRAWIDGHRIFTMRRRRLLSAMDLARSLERGRGPTTAGEFVVELASRLVERVSEVVSTGEDQAADIEAAVLIDGAEQRRAELAELRRQVIALRRFLAPQRDTLARLRGAALPWLSEQDGRRLQEVYEEVARQIEALDALRDQAKVTQEQIQSLLADRLNRRMYVLAILTAVFLPLSFLTGLLGVNLGGIPGAEDASAFPYFSAGLVAVGLLAAWLFRRGRWL